MYFIFELDIESSHTYLSGLIQAHAKNREMQVDVVQSAHHIHLVFNKDDESLEEFLVSLESVLPASLFLGKARHYFSDKKPTFTRISQSKLPLNIAPCPSCQKEMFDVSSKRYYYPFTACNHCGSQHPFFSKYPYTRANTSMKFFSPCQECSQESKTNFMRIDYPLISCIECGIGIRMVDKENEHMALNKGDYRKLFEVSGRAIASGKKVLMKTLHGYRLFYKPTSQMHLANTKLLMADANSLNEHLMLVSQEFNALMSIERPLLRVATRSDELKELFGSSALVKYPDEGMTMLLAREIINAGLQYIVYEECEADTEADYLVDFDIPLNHQKDTKIFINQDTKLFVSGERIVYPK